MTVAAILKHKGNFVATSRWVSPEEVEFFYGKRAALSIGGFLLLADIKFAPLLKAYEERDKLLARIRDTANAVFG